MPDSISLSDIMKKPTIFFALVCLVVVLVWHIGRSAPDLALLRTYLEAFAEQKAQSPFLVATLFFLTYVAVTALSLPIAVWLTLAIGALFGFGWGLVLVSFASSIGATLAFLVSRYLLSDWVHERFGSRLTAIDEGVRRDGAFYLFTLRLIPVVPFFAINLLMGLTPIRATTFYAVSQMGMLAGTAVYVNAGTQIGRLESISGIVSPQILLSFALLGVFPWLARFALGLVKRRRVYARWKKPARYDRNLVVIGGGAAGLVSAYVAAATKARVTLVETHRMGGDCLNFGCVPSKALIRSAKLAHQMRTAGDYGLEPAAPVIGFRKVFERIRQVIAAIEPHDSVERYEGLGVEVLQGRARIVDPWTVEVHFDDGSARRLTTRSIIVATGAAPFIPPLPGLDDVSHLTSDTLWDAFAERDEAPRRLVVLGGGPIGCELAQSFARLGSAVTQVEMLPRVLSREDSEVSEFARRTLEADGVRVLTGHRAIACGVTGSEKWIDLDADGVTSRVVFDDIIVAVGRAARLHGFGLEELGIPARRVIETNEYLETLYPNIYAAGDVAGPYQFTHTAAHQAWFASVNALFGFVRRFRVDYRVIPWATFMDPEVARVGLNEQEARERGIAYEVTRYDLADLDRAITDASAAGFVKVLTERGRDRILGVTIVGEHAADVLSEFVLAMKHGLGLNKILATIHTYPTLAEANKFVAGEWRKAHVNPVVIAWLERLHAWRRGR